MEYYLTIEQLFMVHLKKMEDAQGICVSQFTKTKISIVGIHKRRSFCTSKESD